MSAASTCVTWNRFRMVDDLAAKGAKTVKRSNSKLNAVEKVVKLRRSWLDSGMVGLWTGSGNNSISRLWSSTAMEISVSSNVNL